MLRRLGSYAALLGFQARAVRRNRRWAAAYRRYLAGGADRPPDPVVVQFVPTERCNLRCRMCNQWGEAGYVAHGRHPVADAPRGALLDFLDAFAERGRDFLLSIHGGEPLLYAGLPDLLEWVGRRGIDTLICTNGTLLQQRAAELARVNRHVLYMLSLDGDEETNDRIRGGGASARTGAAVSALRAACRAAGTGEPRILVNCVVSAHNVGRLGGARAFAGRIGAQAVNYQLLEWIPEDAGRAYEAAARGELAFEPTGVWSGSVSPHPVTALLPAVDELYALLARAARWPVPPFVGMSPKGLSRSDARRYFEEYGETFGVRACLLPSYYVRVQSNGQMHGCPLHLDGAPGNVFELGFEAVHFGSHAERFRRRLERGLLPACHRCCALSIAYGGLARVGAPFAPRPAGQGR